MGEVIQFKQSEVVSDKRYGECAACSCDEFHVLMDEDENIMGVECYGCRSEYIFEDEHIQFELEQ